MFRPEGVQAGAAAALTALTVLAALIAQDSPEKQNAEINSKMRKEQTLGLKTGNSLLLIKSPIWILRSRTLVKLRYFSWNSCVSFSFLFAKPYAQSGPCT